LGWFIFYTQIEENIEEAKKYLRKLVKLDKRPFPPSNLYAQSLVLREIGEIGKAENLLKEALSEKEVNKKDQLRINFQLAEIKFQQSELEKAQDIVVQLLGEKRIAPYLSIKASKLLNTINDQKSKQQRIIDITFSAMRLLPIELVPYYAE